MLFFLDCLINQIRQTKHIFFIFRDISNLEEHVNLLNQRYSNQIPGWQTLGYFVYLFPW